MPIELDHILIPVRDRIASAKTLAWILDVPWSESGIGPFAPVYLNDGLTLDFDEAEGPYPVMHYCFRVPESDFAKIVARLQEAGIPYRGTPHGPDDRKINTQHGGSIVYWNEPGGHVWEALTVSYARRPGQEPDTPQGIGE